MGDPVESRARRQSATQLARLGVLRNLLENIYRESIVQHEFSSRPALLFSSILKVRQSGRSVQLLAEDLCVEEIATIAGMISEVVVNAAYLQYASEDELNRYLQFGAVASHSRKAERLLLQSREKTTPFAMQRIKATAVNAVVRAMGPVQDDLKWSRKTLVQRAESADRASHVPVMALLVTTLQSRVQTATLGTFESLAPFIAALDTMDVPKTEERYYEMAEALFGVNLSLMTFCLYLDAYLQLDLGDTIQAAFGSSRRRDQRNSRL